MQQDGFESFTEVGPGNVLQGLVKRTPSKGAGISGTRIRNLNQFHPYVFH